MPNTPVDVDPEDYTIKDPEEFAKNMLRLIEEGSKAMTNMLSHTDSSASPFSSAQEVADASRTMGDITQRWMSEPTRLVSAQTDLVQGYADIWSATMRRMMGEDVEPVAKARDG